ncbi:response regulator [Jiella endophytica]|uniref:histidine kinase n=1 Tax=Jiella endophytica TaxID=2558362 RepID=A0A4Y8R9Y5_9HYPH|nr:response regulator [Jiella endophytica]TFF18046.1 response regulator [Jiella endophytica]
MAELYRLLLVEDNPGDAELARDWIAGILDMKIDVENVVTLRNAITALSDGAFDGIILDLNLPDSTGAATLDNLVPACPNTPIVIFAGSNTALDLTALNHGAGVLEIVAKDDNPDVLLTQSVRSMLKHASAERHHDQFRSLVTVMPDAVVVTNRAGVVQFLNPAAKSLLGKSEDDFLGEIINFAVASDRPSDLDILRTGGRRSVELRVAECTWDYRPALLATMRDVTEERQLSERLRQTQKMEALGLLAGGVAHDINNLLLVVMLYADMIRSAEAPALFANEAGEIVDAVERAQALTRQLLTFSRRQPIERKVISIADIVVGIHSMLRRLMPVEIEITSLIDDDVWSTIGDTNQIEQVLMNLAVNARDAMPDGGRFTIGLENRTLAETTDGASPGDYLCLTVTDEGSGIADADRERIFEPFFTTKPRGQGTGLGLATSYAIVAQMGGHILLDTTVGAGTTFTILLPRAEKATGAETDTAMPANRLGGHETVLVVDDDQAVARAARHILEVNGYAVHAAANGAEAQNLLDKGELSVDLVLSDVVMPLVGGPELGRYVIERFPDLPVVFMTGYSDHPITRQDGESTIEGCPVLLKPFRPQALLSLVRSVLDDRGAQGRA